VGYLTIPEIIDMLSFVINHNVEDGGYREVILHRED
jgi:hypothetical protein